MNGLVVVTALLAPSSPVPAPPGGPAASAVDRNQALNFARVVYQLAQQITIKYVDEKKDHDRLLIESAIRGLHDAAGVEIPDKVLTAVRTARGPTQLIEVLAESRMLLGTHPKLSGAKSLFAAMNGFKYATDPSCALVSPRMNDYASIDQDFDIGIELEGVVGMPWTLYYVESSVAAGQTGAVGWFGPIPRVDEIPCPAAFPWRVHRVIPGSPAQQAGVKPGDVITHVDGAEVSAQTASKIFPGFAGSTQVFDPRTGRLLAPERTFTFRRGNEKPFSATMNRGNYSPESAFGVLRVSAEKWDCMLDREYKIGYIRLGPIEMNLDGKVAAMMEDLTKKGCRALILDLRWCPGGYVTPGVAIAGMFLKEDTVIAKMDYRDPATAGTPPLIRAPQSGPRYTTLPLVVLVGQETTGGGELIASALRDNDRCVVVGQRTVGRASIQNTLEAGFAGVKFRYTVGTSFRPNGKNRQRKPDSQPTDDWGIRPDEGLEVPITADKSIELRKQAELHSLRPADSREALPFDDPTADPFRLVALTYLRKQLAAKK